MARRVNTAICISESEVRVVTYVAKDLIVYINASGDILHFFDKNRK